jgi:hypothetical protein
MSSNHPLEVDGDDPVPAEVIGQWLEWFIECEVGIRLITLRGLLGGSGVPEYGLSQSVS